MTWEFDSGGQIEAGQLRRQIMSAVRAHGAAVSDFGGAELICGELIANAVRHAPGHVTVSLDWQNESPTVTVVEDGPGYSMTRALPAPDTLAEAGRGLYIIRSLARKVQLDAESLHGTAISVELPVFATTCPKKAR